MILHEGIVLLPGEGLSSNSYLLEGERGLLCIDAGTDALAFEAAIAGREARVLLTHGHADHWLGAAGCELELHEADLNDFSGVNSVFSDLPKPKLKALPKRIDWPPFELEIIESPGHTMGSVCFLEKQSGLLFSGDCLFADGMPGRTDLHGGNQTLMQKSLDKLMSLDYECLCPGHGPIE